MIPLKYFLFFGIIKKQINRKTRNILKGFFLLGFAILSIKHPFFLILFTAINVMLYFREKRDFPSYEFSGFVSPILLLPFLEWNEKNDYYKNIIWSLIILVIALLSEKMHYSKNDKDREYSNKKLLVRFGLVLVLSCAIFFSTSLYITSDILHLFYQFELKIIYTFVYRDRECDRRLKFTDLNLFHNTS